MSYVLSAFIAQRAVLEKVVSGVHQARIADLPQGFGMVPYRRALQEELSSASPENKESTLSEFWDLSAQSVGWVQKASLSGQIAYLEIDLFGGVGERAAAVWEQGQLKWGPERNQSGDKVELRENATNRALRIIGVQVNNEYDEFDALELGRYRRTDEWTEIVRP